MVPPQYTPNYKFKFRSPLDPSRQEEREFDEWARPLIKDADTEKRFREIYEKACGLDYVKPNYMKMRENLDTLKKEHTEITQSLQRLGSFLHEGDYDSFFKTLEIPDEKIFQYVLDKLNYQQLPPEQRQAHDQASTLKQRAYELELQNQQLQQAYQQTQVQARTASLDSALDRPDVKTVAEAFDARVGKPGAFRDEVILRGQLAWQTRGVDLTPEQAVKEVLALAGGSVAPAQSPQPQAQAQQRPPVIPNISGKGSSPARRAPRSIEDLKKLANEL